MTDALYFARRASVMTLILGLTLTWVAQAQTTTQITPRMIDYIVVVVNSDPITNSEFRQRLIKVQAQLKGNDASVPNAAELHDQVLEQLVLERVQLQRAQALGLRVDVDSVEGAKRRVASQNGLSLADFERQLGEQGVTPEAFAFDLREQLLLQRLRERKVQERVKISESDIDVYIVQQQRLNPLSNLSLHLAQIVLSLPSGSDAIRQAEVKAQAEALAALARAGQDFAQLARAHSQSSEAEQGGSLGMRTVDRLPELFVNAAAQVAAGTVVGPIQSGAGFHVLKVLAREQVGLPDAVLVQTAARHILLHSDDTLSETQAIAQLQRWRNQIATGRASFEDLARQHSQDGSAPSGGGLGWALPGQFVPEFESAMNALQPGEVSPVVVSRFGVHLIRVDERRQVPMSLEQQRTMVRNLLRQGQARIEMDQWLSELSAQAFVEYREAPQP